MSQLEQSSSSYRASGDDTLTEILSKLGNHHSAIWSESSMSLPALSPAEARTQLLQYIGGIIGEDVTQQERHWSGMATDWCGRPGDAAIMANACICEQLNALKAEQRDKLHGR